jgi:hypothetical protein
MMNIWLISGIIAWLIYVLIMWIEGTLSVKCVFNIGLFLVCGCWALVGSVGD